MNNPYFQMPKVQVLAADASRARFFTLDSPKAPLKEMHTQVNPEARLHAGDLTTDQSGRQRAPMSATSSAMDEASEPKQTEARRFAGELAGRLEKDRRQGKLEKLYLVSSPRFLGELRKQLSDGVKKCIAGTVDKDLSHLEPAALRKHLPEYLK